MPLKNSYKSLAALAFFSFLTLPGAASATIAAGVVNFNATGFNTFTDGSGLHWLRLDSFTGESYDDMAAAAVGKGFQVADHGQVQELLNSIPTDGGDLTADRALWDSYAAIMGNSFNAQYIWGAFLPTMGDWVNYAVNYQETPEWAYFLDSASGIHTDEVPGVSSPPSTMNLFAFYAGQTEAPASIPEPITLGLLGSGLLGLGLLRRRA